MKRLLSCVLLLCLATPATADPLEIVINKGEASTINVDELPTKILIGNPSVLSAEPFDKYVAYRGLGAGFSNLVFLGKTGNKVAEFRVTVNPGADIQVIDERSTTNYACKPACQLLK